MSRLRIWTFVLALAGCASAYGSYHLGFVVWPPEGLSATGSTIAYRPGDMTACLKMRVLGLGLTQNLPFVRHYWSIAQLVQNGFAVR